MTTLAACSCAGQRGGFGPVIVLLTMEGAFLLGQWLWGKFALKGWFCMKNVMKIVAVVALVLAVGVVLAVKQRGADSTSSTTPTTPPSPQSGLTDVDAAGVAQLPRLVSLGAGKCIPCKMMDPIREELRKEYAGRLQVVYHDVWQDREIGERYGIRLIPTLIYFDAEGNELGRTEGYKTKQQIIEAFAAWGVDLNQAATGNALDAASPGAAMPCDLRIQFAAAPAQVAAPSQTPTTTLGDAYPLQGDGPLGRATLTRLSEGRLLQAGNVAIQANDITAMLDQAPAHVQPQLKQNQLFLLEQLPHRSSSSPKPEAPMPVRPNRNRLTTSR